MDPALAVGLACRTTTSPGPPSRTVTFTRQERKPSRRTRCASRSWAAPRSRYPRSSRAHACWSSWATVRSMPRRFFFDLGGGSIRNVIAMQVPIALVNDLFISHLHVDHYADLPLTYAFRAFLGGFTPFRMYGPSGRTPELGTKAMIKGLKDMTRWHTENFQQRPNRRWL